MARSLPLLALLAAAPAQPPDVTEPLPDAGLETDPDPLDTVPPEEAAPGAVDPVGPVSPIGDVETVEPVDPLEDVEVLPPAPAPGPALPSAPEGPGVRPVPAPPLAPQAGAPAGPSPQGPWQRIAELEERVAALQAQQPALEEQVAESSALLDELIERGDALEAARLARAATLDGAAAEIEALLPALRQGTSDFGGGLGTLEAKLADTAQNAYDAGALQESQLIDAAAGRVAAARVVLEQGDLHAARVALTTALPLVQRAATLAASSEQRPLFAP